MPVTLRKRLQCHYCGKRLNTARRDGSKIKCDGCLADNFFDSDDNFTDVPVEEVQRAGGHFTSAEIASESDVFCSTCLKNQYLYTAALSEYLPDEDDPSYEAIEQALPEYQKQLDLRYPRCCRNCEPRVQAQLRKANYAAKSDHLQRKMQRDRNTRVSPGQYIRGWLISAAGAGHLASVLAQLFWHLLSSQANTDLIMAGITPRQCFQQYPVPTQCTEYAATWLPYSLIAAFLCFWWNPKWQHRLTGGEGRLIGLSRYYRLQLVVLGLRFAAWVVLRDLPEITQYAAPLHALVFLIIAAASLYLLFGVVQIDNTPLVDWNKAQTPLVHPDQYEGPEVNHQSSTASYQSSHVLPVEALASTSRSLPYDAWQPPTPPLEEDGMDWTPGNQNFNPRSRVQKARVDQKSPFYGTLPAKPIRGSLNPKLPSAPVQRNAIGLPPGFFGLSKARDQGSRHISTPVKDVFAPPKFFANERQSDTGLETLFDTVFSVKDQRERNNPSKNGAGERRGPSDSLSSKKVDFDRSPSQPGHPPMIGVIVSCAIVVSLIILLASLIPMITGVGEDVLPSPAIPYLAVIPFLHVSTDLIQGETLLASTLLFASFEIACTCASYFLLPGKESNHIHLWNKLVLGIVCLFLLRELYRFGQLQSAAPPTSTAVQQHMQESMWRIENDQVEDATVSQPQPTQTSQDVVPGSMPYNQIYTNDKPMNIASFQPAPAKHMAHDVQMTPQRRSNYTALRSRDSDESISSTASTQTTATSSGWKTPQNTGRTMNWQSHRGTPSESGAISRGLGGLTLSNDFGLGAGITRPRDRPTPGKLGTFNRYR